jgi:tRNA(Ile2) C34 agmatinyltransferase TiaS
MRLKREEMAAVVILIFASLAVCCLYLLSGYSKPYSYSSADGDRVSVTGPVLHSEKTYQGGHVILTVRTDAGPLSVFVPASSDAFKAASEAAPGDEIEAIGTVQTYKGAKEVVAEKIIKKD